MKKAISSSQNADEPKRQTSTQWPDTIRAAMLDVRALLDSEVVGQTLFPNGISKLTLRISDGVFELNLDVDAGDDTRSISSYQPAAATKRVSIDFSANGEGTLEFSDKSFRCLGNPNIKYAKDLTVSGVLGVDKFLQKHSNEFDVDMNFAILIMGDRGIYIHEGEDTISENGGVSAGCIHVAKGAAEEFYNWVDGRTRILISYPW